MRTHRRPSLLLVGALTASMVAMAPAHESVIAPAAADAAAATTSAHLADDPDPATLGADHLVVAGAREPGWPQDVSPRLEYLAYYPTDLRIHRGDVVYFRLDGFHTVTFSAQEEPRRGFLRRDEVEPATAFTNESASDPTCGRNAAAPPCVYDDTEKFVNSGWNLGVGPLENDLKLKIDLPPGTYTYYCSIHTGMEGTVEVVDETAQTEPIATPERVAEQRHAEITADTAAAHAVLADPPPMQPPARVGDHRKWFVQVGAFTADQRVAVNQYFPANLTIEPGDEVEFAVPRVEQPLPGRTEVVIEGHTVTFEPDAVMGENVGFLQYMNPGCETDDPAGGAPAIPMMSALLFGCPHDALTFELGALPIMIREPLSAPGNVVTHGVFHDSGLMAPDNSPARACCEPWTGEPLPSKAQAQFPAEGSFAYICYAHGTVMGGVIDVAG